MDQRCKVEDGTALDRCHKLFGFVDCIGQCNSAAVRSSASSKSDLQQTAQSGNIQFFTAAYDSWKAQVLAQPGMTWDKFKEQAEAALADIERCALVSCLIIVDELFTCCSAN